MLGLDFMNESESCIKFGPDGPEMNIRSIDIPIFERSKRQRKSGVNLATYAIREIAAPSEEPLKTVKAAEYKKIHPWTGTVTKVILPYVEWPDQAMLKKSSHDKGFIVEKQMITIRRNVPTPKAKCRSACAEEKCVRDCPRVHFYYALALVYNVSNRVIYLSPGETVTSIEPQQVDSDITEQVNYHLNLLINQRNKVVDEINKKLDKDREQRQKRNKKAKEREKEKKLAKSNAAADNKNCSSNQTAVVEQTLKPTQSKPTDVAS